MDLLFRPWRMAYVRGADDQEGCFLCEALSGDPAAHFLLARREHAFAVLNAYPYNTGHLMVAPPRHIGELADLTGEERAGIMGLLVDCVAALGDDLHPDGFNLGANLGWVAGAGLPDHLHMHVVPRWAGDTNFMPVVAGAKVLPEALAETYRRLKSRLE